MKTRSLLLAVIFGLMSVFAFAATTDEVLQQAAAAAKAGDTAKVAQLAKDNPSLAPQIAAAATQAAPAQAVNIAKAVAQAVPAAAASVAVAVAQVAPSSAVDIAAGVAQVVPSQALTVASAVAKAIPSATPEAVAKAVSNSTGTTISTSDVASNQSSKVVVEAIQNAGTPPVLPEARNTSPNS
jgi:hypothetical protein